VANQQLCELAAAKTAMFNVCYFGDI